MFFMLDISFSFSMSYVWLSTFLIFLPTGGTEKVAKAITKNWKQIETLDLTLPDTDYAKISFEKDSLVLIAMPSFGGVAPNFALKRASMLKGNGALCAIATIYGNRAYGLCAQKCPAGAIYADQPKLSDKSKCISCMRCVSICPVHAKKASPDL